MSRPSPQPLAGVRRQDIRDVLVGITDEGRRDQVAFSPGYGLTLRGTTAPNAPCRLRAVKAGALARMDGPRGLLSAVSDAELAPHLACHALHVAVGERAVERDPAETLWRAARGFRADMIAKGAYRHSRMRERVSWQSIARIFGLGCARV
jgi:hypothetical protein